MGFRRFTRVVSLGLFIALVLLTATAARPEQASLFLRLDPSLALISALAGRFLNPGLTAAGVVLVSVLIFGRVFCGHLCPLGLTLDLAGRHRSRRSVPDEYRRIKYVVLAVMLGAAMLGVSLAFLGSPLALATRFYGTIVQPVLALGLAAGRDAARPLAEALGRMDLSMAQVRVPRFAAQAFILVFFIALFGLERIRPRFWCRHLCPSGALFALCSPKPLIRRTVSDACTQCGRCVRACPMGAIPSESPETTRHRECVVCLECVKICPEGAVSFGHGGIDAPTRPDVDIPGRRRFLTAGLAGAGTAVLAMTGLDRPAAHPLEGDLPPAELLRPPGARPEPDFLALCVRCGECMTACPTNTLQPVWLAAGGLGWFSPALTPRRGPCDPLCRACGTVCPTGAILKLTSQERIWAKTGTARVDRHACLAWDQGKACLVCDEVCPYDAVVFRPEPGSPVAVPHVLAERCSGCGACEHFCPVRGRPAIRVFPVGALRLSKPDFRAEGRAQGLDLSLRPYAPETVGKTPGFTGEAPGFTGEAPGFTGEAPGFTGDEKGNASKAPGFTD